MTTETHATGVQTDVPAATTEVEGRRKYKNRGGRSHATDPYIGLKFEHMMYNGIQAEITHNGRGAARPIPPANKKKPPTEKEMQRAEEAEGKRIPPHMREKIQLRRKTALHAHIYRGIDARQTAAYLATVGPTDLPEEAPPAKPSPKAVVTDLKAKHRKVVKRMRNNRPPTRRSRSKVVKAKKAD
ncbi:MAG TPA: hypothetical protein VJH33_00335 [Candidatus Paceibacterota bacterium]